MTEYHIEKTDFVRSLITEMWVRAGASDVHASRIAEVVTLSDRLGKHQQGIGVLEVLYPGWVAGDIDLAAVPEVVDEGPSWAVVDGRRSTGFYAITIAMEKAIEKARVNGVGIGMARNHWDAGGFGAYSLMAAAEGMTGLATNTTPPMSAPIGAMSNVMSAAPLSLASPTGAGRPPMLVDVKTSETYEGELTQAIMEGRPFDDKILVDPTTGELTDDPAPYREEFDEGVYNRFAHYTCAPTFGTYRQQSMNVFVEMLCALVPGGLVTPDIPVDLREYESADGEGPTTVPASFVMAINPRSFSAAGEYEEKLDRYSDAVKSVPRREGFDVVYLPGERGLRRIAGDADEDIKMLKIHWDAFLYWADRFGVDVEAKRSAGSS